MTPIPPMIEKVARAIHAALSRSRVGAYIGPFAIVYRDGEGDTEEYHGGYTFDGRVDPEEVARAAIEALREPTEEMLASADKIIEENHFVQRGYGYDGGPQPLYRAMIDKALGK